MYSGLNPINDIDLFRTTTSSKINNYINISTTYTYSDTHLDESKNKTSTISHRGYNYPYLKK